MFNKESLNKLRDAIDLIEVLSKHLELKRAGVYYRSCCPFHAEKTPSFIVRRGERHYHCFGCGAHGDAIQFLIDHLGFSFVEAIEALATQFHISLERNAFSGEREKESSQLKEACGLASLFFHTYLLYTRAGVDALHYLYKRGITIDFIRYFEIGLAPKEEFPFLAAMRGKGIGEEVLIQAGLLSKSRRSFFADRITFPLRSLTGGVLGFSARKYREETFGGKYINSPETAIFKKSRLLFGGNYSRRRMIKERRALIVEGQIDCLKLIEAGLNLTVAPLGTAFGEELGQELKKWGVHKAYLLFDGDRAGQTAASKVGDLLQKIGIEVFVASLGEGVDPDGYLNQSGVQKLIALLEEAVPYLVFQIRYLEKQFPLHLPASKTALVQEMVTAIAKWNDPLMVHESLRKLASLLNIPEKMLGVEGLAMQPLRYTDKLRPSKNEGVDAHRILETDLLRWLVFQREAFLSTARFYLKEEDFWVESCRQLYKALLSTNEQTSDLLTLASGSTDLILIDEILQKKINRQRSEKGFLESLQKLLDRNWMESRAKVKALMEQGGHSEENLFLLAKEFDRLKQTRNLVALQPVNAPSASADSHFPP